MPLPCAQEAMSTCSRKSQASSLALHLCIAYDAIGKPKPPSMGIGHVLRVAPTNAIQLPLEDDGSQVSGHQQAMRRCPMANKAALMQRNVHDAFASQACLGEIEEPCSMDHKIGG